MNLGIGMITDNISKAYYHIQLTIKYRKSLFNEITEKIILDVMKEFKDQYMIETTHVGFDQNHVHILCRFLPKYSGGQVIKLIKSSTAKAILNDTLKLRSTFGENSGRIDTIFEL